jgi:hypothetical protein
VVKSLPARLLFLVALVVVVVTQQPLLTAVLVLPTLAAVVQVHILLMTAPNTTAALAGQALWLFATPTHTMLRHQQQAHQL